MKVARAAVPWKQSRPLQGKLPQGIQIQLDYGKGDEAELATAISALDGVVLVCWQHEDIATIANALIPPPLGVPSNWPKERFNVIFRFDRSGDGGNLDFSPGRADPARWR